MDTTVGQIAIHAHEGPMPEWVQALVAEYEAGA